MTVPLSGALGNEEKSVDKLSDTQIRANLRSVMNHHHVDLNKTSFVCAKGVVRMVGEIAKQQAFAAQALNSNDIEALEKDMTSMRGVVRVHMDLKNWLRQSTGSWLEKNGKPPATEEPTEAEILASLMETRIMPVDAYFASKHRRDRKKPA